MEIHIIHVPSTHRHMNSLMHGLKGFSLSSIECPLIISDGSYMSCCSYTHKELFRSRRTKRKWNKMDILSTVHFYTCLRQNYSQFRDPSKSDLECQWHMGLRCLEFDDFVFNSNA